MVTRVLGLDVDGVLNSSTFLQTWKENSSDSMDDFFAAMLDPQAVACLNRLVKAAGIDLILLSSSWRKHCTPEAMTTLLQDKGFEGTIAGSTGTLNQWWVNWSIPEIPRRQGLDFADPFTSKHERGIEIELWLQERFTTAQERRDIQLAILDDDSDMGRLLPWHVQTLHKFGLRDRHIEQVKAALAKPLGDLLVERHPWLMPPGEVWTWPKD